MLIFFHLILPTFLISVSFVIVFLTLIKIKEFEDNIYLMYIIAIILFFVSLWLFGFFNGTPTYVNSSIYRLQGGLQ